MNNLFFQLLQVAVGNRKELTRQLSADEWVSLYSICKKQSLIGIGYFAITRLPKEQRPPLRQFAQWIHDAERIKEKNARISADCAALYNQLEHDGMNCCIIKGQSNLINYGLTSVLLRREGDLNLADYRTAGDIDVLVRPKDGTGVRGTVEYGIRQCNLYKVPVGKICYHHMDLPWGRDTEVEAHHRATWLNSYFKNRRLQSWLEVNMPFKQGYAQVGDAVFPVPSTSYNSVYQLLHIYKHLFEEGIGLRQILDYYFVLVALSKDSSAHKKEEIMHQLSRFGMKKFASAVMWVLQTVFAMPDEYLFCQPNKKEGKFLLKEIMLAGNFGKYDERIKRETPSIPLFRGKKVSPAVWHAWEKTKHNLRILTHYPEEVMWEPVFRLYHYFWRRFELWKY